MICPICQGALFVKKGRERQNNNKFKQRYQCKGCGRVMVGELIV